MGAKRLYDNYIYKLDKHLPSSIDGYKQRKQLCPSV